jgi:hypothetical protein
MFGVGFVPLSLASEHGDDLAVGARRKGDVAFGGLFDREVRELDLC